MGGYDEGVANLERFIGVILDAKAKVQEATTAMEQQADELDRLEGTAGDQLEAFNDALDNFEDELADAEGEAVGQLDKVAEEGHEIADDRLADASRNIDEGESDFENTLQVSKDDLDKDAASLTENGFQFLATSLDAIQEEVDTSRQEAEAAFQSFDGVVQGFQQEAETAFDQGDQAVDAAVTGLNEDGSQLATHAADCAQGFQDGARALEAECSTLEDGLDSAYQEQVDKIDSAGQDLIDSVHTLGEDTAGYVVTSSQDQIDAPVGLVMADAVPPLMDELGELASMLSEAEQTTAELDTLIQELEKCQRVVSTIDELLNAVE